MINQRIGQSTNEIFFDICECCNGNGLIKSKNIIFQEIISIIKNILTIDKLEKIELKIDKEFYEKNGDELSKRIKSIPTKKVKINYNFVEKVINIFEFESDLIEKIAVNLKNKQVINIQKAKIAEDTPKNTPEDTTEDTSKDEKKYIRKIKKKKVIENKNNLKTKDAIPESEKTYRRKIKKKIIIENTDTSNNNN